MEACAVMTRWMLRVQLFRIQLRVLLSEAREVGFATQLGGRSHYLLGLNTNFSDVPRSFRRLGDPAIWDCPCDAAGKNTPNPKTTTDLPNRWIDFSSNPCTTQRAVAIATLASHGKLDGLALLLGQFKVVF